MNWLKRLFGQSPDDTSSASDVDDDFRRFIGEPRNVRLNIIRVEPHPMMGVALIVLRPAAPIDSPESLVSYIKARLYCVMPLAMRSSPELALSRQGNATLIRCGGRDFPEPAWFVHRGRQYFGPLGFRDGEWNEDQGQYEFSLMCISMAVDPSVLAGQGQIIGEIARNYRDHVRFIEI